MGERFVIVTQDGTGLGLAKMLLEEEENVVMAVQPALKEKELENLNKVGENWVPVTSLTAALAKYRNEGTRWIFDGNHLSDLADELRADNEKVFGTSMLSYSLENDRAFAVEVAQKYGLQPPPTYEFMQIQAALDFLDENREIAYVFKPNAGGDAYTTFVPFREDGEDANRELYFYLRHRAEANQGFILQERKHGVEVNVEVWLYQGKPFFATCTFENKRKHESNSGEMSGCAGDIVFPIDLASPLVRRTVGKMLPFYQRERYTGTADVNVIIGDNETWFLEVCDRFGYNAHPTLFIGLRLDGFGRIMADFMDGNVGDFYSRFRQAFGASITCFLDHPREGLPLYVNSRMCTQFYPFDGYKDGEDLLLTGYSHEVGIFVDYDYTLKDAAESCHSKLFYGEAVSYPDIWFRHDLHKDDYRGAPGKQYAALRSMRLL